MTVAVSNTQCVLRRLGRSPKPLSTADLRIDPSDGSDGRIKYMTLHNAQNATRRLLKQGLAQRQGRLWTLTDAGRRKWLRLAAELGLEP